VSARASKKDRTKLVIVDKTRSKIPRRISNMWVAVGGTVTMRREDVRWKSRVERETEIN
jgi:hypothetical protein